MAPQAFINGIDLKCCKSEESRSTFGRNPSRLSLLREILRMAEAVTRNILTLDIEGWYQSSLEILGPEHKKIPLTALPDERVVCNTRRLLHILEEYDVKVTCFVLGSVAETYPNLVREIHNSGHEVATHGYAHELVYKLTPDQFRDDLRRSTKLIESIIGEKVDGYRAPYFSITEESEWALEVLEDLELHYDSSIFPIKRTLYGFTGFGRFPHFIKIKNGGSLLELPVSTITFLKKTFPIGGGGYFRLLPYALIQKAIRTINIKGQPAVFYLHPYELDTEELRNPFPGETWKTRLVRLSQGMNRGKTEMKLRRLLADFAWTSVGRWLSEKN